MELYFADPGCPYQRGTNENTNGLIRQYFPKGTDFRDISYNQVRQVEKLLNTRPRECLGFRTPSEVFYQKSASSKLRLRFETAVGARRTPEDTLRILERGGLPRSDGFVASLLLSTRGVRGPGHYRVDDAHLKDQPGSAIFIAPAEPEPGPVLCGGILEPGMTEPLLRRGSCRRRATVTIKIDNQHAAG